MTPVILGTAVVTAAAVGGMHLLAWLIKRTWRRWLEAMPFEQRMRAIHYDDQMQGLWRQVGPAAAMAFMRAGELRGRLADTAAEDRASLEAEAARWQERGQRWRKDNKVQR